MKKKKIEQREQQFPHTSAKTKKCSHKYRGSYHQRKAMGNSSLPKSKKEELPLMTRWWPLIQS